MLGTVCDTTTEPETTTTVTTLAGTTPCATFTSGGNANGAMCVFPFRYQGVTFYECTLIGGQSLWCATTSDYDADQLWGYCAGRLTFSK